MFTCGHTRSTTQDSPLPIADLRIRDPVNITCSGRKASDMIQNYTLILNGQS
jgi:hypothetical protein